MLLNNYWNWKAFTNKQAPAATGSAGMDIGVIDTSGEAISFWYGFPGNGYSNLYTGAYSNWSLKSGLSVAIGTGTTEPQGDDYEMESKVTMANLAVSVSVSADGEAEKTVITVTGTNTTGDALTITEIGVYKSAYANNNAYGVAHTVLLLRELLKKPITAAAGESFSFTIDWVEE